VSERPVPRPDPAKPGGWLPNAPLARYFASLDRSRLDSTPDPEVCAMLGLDEEQYRAFRSALDAAICLSGPFHYASGPFPAATRETVLSLLADGGWTATHGDAGVLSTRAHFRLFQQSPSSTANPVPFGKPAEYAMLHAGRIDEIAREFERREDEVFANSRCPDGSVTIHTEVFKGFTTFGASVQLPATYVGAAGITLDSPVFFVSYPRTYATGSRNGRFANGRAATSGRDGLASWVEALIVDARGAETTAACPFPAPPVYLSACLQERLL
jgi:hypothetical protein